MLCIKIVNKATINARLCISFLKNVIFNIFSGKMVTSFFLLTCNACVNFYFYKKFLNVGLI